MPVHLEDLATLQKHALHDVFSRGAEKPCWDDLLGYEFHGWNCARWLPIRKFVKGFFLGTFEGEQGVPLGYNIPVARDGTFGYDPQKPWQLLPDDAHPQHERFFAVSEVDKNSWDNKFPKALLLDYSISERWTPLRDYLKQIDDDHFIGKAYGALGLIRFPISYFILERFCEASYEGEGVPGER
ncbi:hypothetical protein HYS49_02340 [Candidatus Woesearchaeota archaeon]|nr:hypothetical protein [Candidatus Woesearchaeota archaeon]